MVESKTKAVGISIQLSPKAREIVDQLRGDTGIPNTEALSRILEWFAGQDRKLRIAILTNDVDTRHELLRLALRDMAAMDTSAATIGGVPVTLKETAAVIRAMADRIEVLERTYAPILREAANPKKK